MATKYKFTKEECHTVHSDTMLRRMLSMTAVLPTSADSGSRVSGHTQIGKGQCGKTYTLLRNVDQVYKTPNSLEKIPELQRDFLFHTAVSEAFNNAPEALSSKALVPRLHGYKSQSVEGDLIAYEIQRHSRGQIDPMAYRSHRLMSERIYPLHDPIPTALLESLIPEITPIQRETCLNNPTNNNCLVRLYLGCRGGSRSKINPEMMSLRNFPLHVDEMERLCLPITAYITTIAQSLALMHWKAGIDANDVEFVFGSSRNDSNSEGHTVSIWLLDFNQCQKFSHDQAGLKQLVDGFWWNDPYYPRPGSSNSQDKVWWTTFLSKYLDASALLTDSKMPREFIQAVEAEGERRRVRPSLFG
ncbi:unnamed protein product [Aureobasidium mustum]|uniref:DUF3669 domain-containing protein n=1 Tax=Aureobasidium mustum TaxID=2773714 RepID=A0A9N8PD94_9PEZI|nr:unnamed protein product [Aureobasidium mustum]